MNALVTETHDALTVAFDVPDELADTFTYEAGQFITLRLDIEGEEVMRSYSMSSAPALDTDLRITVKRVPGGLVSNWIHDHLREGDTVLASAPAGVFVLQATEGAGPQGPAPDTEQPAHDIVAFAAGSGITPIYSILRTALATTDRRVRLLFANRDRESTIFDRALDELSQRYADRFELVHHHDIDDGYITAAEVADFAVADMAGSTGTDNFVCGPEPFMRVVEAALAGIGTDPARIRIERFTSEVDQAPPPPTAHGAAGADITITLRGRTEVVEQRGDATILQSARWAGLPAPATCEAGHCGTCMALVTEGHAAMRLNDALTADEVDEGWVLTCQAIPVTDVRVTYDA